jgi:signal peptidase I
LVTVNEVENVSPAPDRVARSARFLRWSGRRLALFSAIAGIVLLRLAVVEPIRIESASMEPTLRDGERVLTQTLVVGQQRNLRGKLVTFHHPDSGVLTLKRVSAIDGDVVEIRDGILYVNAVRQAEPYVDAESLDGVHFGPVHVPLGTVFLLGDNRANSDDSRNFGALPVSHLVGHVVVRVWPPQRAGTVR